jgi:hypothetical protein
MPDRFITIENKAGEPQKFSGYKVTPFTQVVSLKIPGLTGRAAWIRPVSVLVDKGNGEEQVIPIIDITRLLQLFYFGFFVIFMPLLIMMQNRKKGQ